MREIVRMCSSTHLCEAFRRHNRELIGMDRDWWRPDVKKGCYLLFIHLYSTFSLWAWGSLCLVYWAYFYPRTIYTGGASLSAVLTIKFDGADARSMMEGLIWPSRCNQKDILVTFWRGPLMAHIVPLFSGLRDLQGVMEQMPKYVPAETGQPVFV